MDLMSFTLYVPDMMQAKLVKRNFQKDPQLIYRDVYKRQAQINAGPELNTAAVRLVLVQDGLKQRGLAAAVGSQQKNSFPPPQLEVHTLKQLSLIHI